MEKKADVAARLARNSAAIVAKKAPKLYMVPKTTKPTVKATSTMTHERRESSKLVSSDGGWRADTFTTFLVGGRKGLGSRENTKPLAGTTLRFLLPLKLLAVALATTGKSSHVKSNSPVERAAALEIRLCHMNTTTIP